MNKMQREKYTGVQYVQVGSSKEGESIKPKSRGVTRRKSASPNEVLSVRDTDIGISVRKEVFTLQAT